MEFHFQELMVTIAVMAFCSGLAFGTTLTWFVLR